MSSEAIPQPSETRFPAPLRPSWNLRHHIPSHLISATQYVNTTVVPVIYSRHGQYVVAMSPDPQYRHSIICSSTRALQQSQSRLSLKNRSTPHHYHVGCYSKICICRQLPSKNNTLSWPFEFGQRRLDIPPFSRTAVSNGYLPCTPIAIIQYLFRPGRIGIMIQLYPPLREDNVCDDIFASFFCILLSRCLYSNGLRAGTAWYRWVLAILIRWTRWQTTAFLYNRRW